MAKSPRSRSLVAFGLNVRKRRESLALTQLETAERADLDPTYISGIERGIRNPSLLSICRVAMAAGREYFTRVGRRCLLNVVKVSCERVLTAPRARPNKVGNP